MARRPRTGSRGPFKPGAKLDATQVTDMRRGQMPHKPPRTMPKAMPHRSGLIPGPVSKPRRRKAS